MGAFDMGEKEVVVEIRARQEKMLRIERGERKETPFMIVVLLILFLLVGAYFAY